MERDRTAQLVAWMAGHPDEVDQILPGDKEDIELEDFLYTLELLLQEGQPELAVIMLEAWKSCWNTHEIGDQFWKLLAVEGWNQMGTQAALAKLRQLIQNRIQEGEACAGPREGG